MASPRHPNFLSLLLIISSIGSICNADLTVGVVTQEGRRGDVESRLLQDVFGNVTEEAGRLMPLLREVPQRDPLAAAAAVCSLADEGVAAVVDGGHSCSVGRVYGVPCISLRGASGKTAHDTDALTLHMEPDKNLMSRALVDFLQELRWFSLSVVYDSVEHLTLVEPLLGLPGFRVNVVKMDAQPNYEDVMTQLEQARSSRVLVVLEPPHLREFLGASKRPNGKPLDLLVATVHTRLGELKAAGRNIMAVRLGSQQHGMLEAEEALTLDASAVLKAALHHHQRSGAPPLRTESGLCLSRSHWRQGPQFFQALAQTKLEGASGPVEFNDQGNRVDFELSIVNFYEGITSEIVRWQAGSGVPANGRVRRDIRQLSGGRKPTLRVAAVLSTPYVVLKELGGNDTEELFGNDRYEGFSVDLMDEIAKEVGFNYILDINDEGLYGSKDPQTGEYNGIIGDLAAQRVDAAIGDLTISESRESVVDFTDPWYSFGIGLMVYHTGPKSSGPIFGFLNVFESSLWWVLLAATLGTAVVLFLLSRLSPYERVGAMDQEPQVWTPFTLCYSTWFALGTLFRQFIYFQPRAPSTRLVTLAWWLLVIIVAAHYVANLASFFTLRGLRSLGTIKSVYDLPDQNQITYNALHGGSTWAFFRDAKSESLQRVYSAMYNRASEQRIKSSAQGVEEVLEAQGSFGFLMEEPTLEYVTERNCELKQLGGTVGSRDYAIALQQDSPYLDYFNDALYSIRESGQLQALRDIWWREKRGGGQCESRFLSTEPSATASQVELDDLAGPLLLLVAGVAVGLVLALLECCYYATASANAKGSSVGSEMSQQFSQAITTQPAEQLPLSRQPKA
ncbi:glutamate receptor U1-like isoform X2 [Hyalella azteca]|uniref:Glutamate receptor U1-like isoform X1 n=1 Tax=Hyalella azteca TaxID=294128 RepID=A0A8B7PI86_HYAAZ|nr:glutamate receptor U1-like isoform X1 [Hyalella azteca]XP_018025873.1 glutamate receptor U1-like isoform X2 [Hyalella azteca]